MTAAVALNVGVSVMDVADASREAVERFLQLAPTKAELGAWLRGIYRRATSFIPQPVRSLAVREHSLDDGDVADVVHHAQCAARQAIAAAISPGAEGIARSLPDVLHLAAITDMYGGCGFTAVDTNAACLADRVLALIVAEYLTRPDEFIESAASFRPIRSASTGQFPTVQADALIDGPRYGSAPRGPNRGA
jgi:hypothetical protein